MFKLIKLLLFLILVAGVAGYFWLMPKYQYIKDNPGFCVNLTEQIFYCGTEADLKGTLEATTKKVLPDLQEGVKNLINRN